MASLLVSDLGDTARRMTVGSARCRKRGAESLVLGATSRVAADCRLDARNLAYAPRPETAIGSRWAVASLDADTHSQCKSAARSEEGNDGET